MFRLFSTILTLLCGVAVAQENGQPGPANAPGGDEKVPVAVHCALESVPEGLKAGAKVHLKHVTGKTVTGTGRVSINTAVLVPDIEVASITRLEKPEAPDQAVKVEFRVTKDEATRIERAKAQRVRVVERNADGSFEQKTRPLTFRLELAQVEKK